MLIRGDACAPEPNLLPQNDPTSTMSTNRVPTVKFKTFNSDDSESVHRAPPPTQSQYVPWVTPKKIKFNKIEPFGESHKHLSRYRVTAVRLLTRPSVHRMSNFS